MNTASVLLIRIENTSPKYWYSREVEITSRKLLYGLTEMKECHSERGHRVFYKFGRMLYGLFSK